MADLVATLAANGILIPEVMVQACDAEGLPYAVGATILEGESSGGLNIWGHDGVDTGGLYTKGGPVTRENYLAYRSAMRAGQIGRNGAGPCQCTSAQYQDTADALGGCWDPLANCRSGFRGMGALIKAYGSVQLGAQHYNGSGPDAVLYGQRFVARYRRWVPLLAGAANTTGDDVLDQQDIDRIANAVTNAIVNYPIYDYTRGQDGQPPPVMPWAIATAWGTAHAAFARSEVAALQVTVNQVADALATQQGIDPTELRQVIADAIADTVTVSGELTLSPSTAPSTAPSTPPGSAPAAP